jgi:hypothetical protein
LAEHHEELIPNSVFSKVLTVCSFRFHPDLLQQRVQFSASGHFMPATEEALRGKRNRDGEARYQ